MHVSVGTLKAVVPGDRRAALPCRIAALLAVYRSDSSTAGPTAIEAVRREAAARDRRRDDPPRLLVGLAPAGVGLGRDASRLGNCAEVPNRQTMRVFSGRLGLSRRRLLSSVERRRRWRLERSRA